MKIISRQEAISQGLKRYFTGKPCVHGHVDERRVDGHCLTCSREYQKKNKERIKKKKVEYCKKNKERIHEYNAERYKKSKEGIKKKSAEYQKKNREHVNKRQREYRKKNKERINRQREEQVKTLHDNYIKTLLHRQFGLKIEDITPELIEAKRQDLLTKRLMAKIKQT